MPRKMQTNYYPSTGIVRIQYAYELTDKALSVITVSAHIAPFWGRGEGATFRLKRCIAIKLI